MDKVREEFEIWANQFFKLEIEEWGEYVDNETHWAWLAWQASQESLIVELPRCWNDEQRDYRDELVEILEKVGVKYK